MTEIKRKVSVIVPVLNSKKYLHGCLNSILAAMEQYGDAELIVLDNGSDDGSYEILTSEYGGCARVQQIRDVPVGALRNRGISLSDGEYIAFIDSDCVIVPDYFEQAVAVLNRADVHATGSEYALQDSSRWIEKTWYVIHTPPCDGFVTFIPSGNLVAKRHALLAVGGFNEKMITCEDSDLGARLRAAGFGVYQAHSVRAFHAGADKSLRVFFLKNTWRSMGMFGMLRNAWFSKPLLTVFAHLLLLLLAVTNLLLSHSSIASRLVTFILLVNLAPLLTILYRAWQVKGVHSLFRAMFLYHIYFLARLYAVWITLASLGVLPEAKHAMGTRLHNSAKSPQ